MNVLMGFTIAQLSYGTVSRAQGDEEGKVTAGSVPRVSKMRPVLRPIAYNHSVRTEIMLVKRKVIFEREPRSRGRGIGLP